MAKKYLEAPTYLVELYVCKLVDCLVKMVIKREPFDPKPGPICRMQILCYCPKAIPKIEDEIKFLKLCYSHLWISFANPLFMAARRDEEFFHKIRRQAYHI